MRRIGTATWYSVPDPNVAVVELAEEMRDIQGPPAEKLALFQNVKAAGGFANEDPTELKAAEDICCGRLRRRRSGVREAVPVAGACTVAIVNGGDPCIS